MTQRSADRLKALLLILMAIFFAQKFWSGTLYYYIGPRFGWLALLAVILLIMLAGAYNLVGRKDAEQAPHHNHDHDHDHSHEKVSIWSLVIVALPLVLGVVIPAQPLGASAISTRGISTDVGLDASGTNTLTIVASERNILDWVRVINANPDAAALNGQEADVVGFVYTDPRFADDQIMVGRFTLTCCVADAMAIGVVVQSDQVAEFEQDTWVRVRGVFREGTMDGEPFPILIATEITRVQEPEQPYLYP